MFRIAILVAALLAAAPVTGWPEPATDETAPTIRVRRIAQIGGDGRVLLQPAAASFGAEGRLYILDGQDDYVKVFASSGKFLFSFGKRGDGDARLKKPSALTVSREGNVFVADAGHQRIAVFGKEGDFKYGFDLRPDRYQYPARPTDIVVNDIGRKCFIVDNTNHRVIVYRVDGKHLGEWGQVGYEKGEFRYPFRIAAAADGDLFVTDVINTRVQHFSSEGIYQRSLGEWGADLGRFFRPSGIALDHQERVLVSDGYLGVIQAFTRSGTVIGLVVNEKGERIVFGSPTDLDVSPDQLLAVTESFANRVSVYRIEE